MNRCILLALGAIVAMPLWAAVYYAAPDGDDSAEKNSEETPWTLQKCETSARNADEIRLLKGRYLLEKALTPWVNVTVRGWNADRDEVILDGQGKVRCVYVQQTYYTDIHLENLTIANGYSSGTTAADSGAGVYVTSDGFTMTNCIVTCCTNVNKEGGAVYGLKNRQQFVDCLFSKNFAKGGGAIKGYADVIANCTFAGNHSAATGQAGGGALNMSGAVAYSDCVFSNNTTLAYAADIYAAGAARMTNCRFYNSHSISASAAIYEANAALVLNDCYFTNCVSDINTVAYGGAISLSNGCLAMTNSTFVGCAGCAGGVASVLRSSPADVHRASLVAKGCTFRGNSATGTFPSTCRGGVFFVEGASTAEIDGCVFCENFSTNHNAVLWNKANSAYACESFVIRNCLFDGNKSASGLAANATAYSAIQTSTGNFLVQNCTFVNNTSSGTYPAMNVYNAGAEGIVRNCLMYRNLSAKGSQYDDVNGINDLQRNLYTNCFIYSGAVTVNGCFGKDLDPKFVDEAKADYRLEKGSPCVNAGFNEPWMIGARDLQNVKKVRRIEQDIVDVGCYEYRPTPGLQLILR